FSEAAATERQQSLDVAELLASLATLVGPERSATSAAAVLSNRQLSDAAPLIQPLALSAATRRRAKNDHLLSRTRSAVATAIDEPIVEVARLQRVRMRTLLMIAVGAGAFYFILPQLAQVGDSWKAFQSADFTWLPFIIAMS